MIPWNETQPGDVEKLIGLVKGRGGADEETLISASPRDLQEGTVRVSTMKGSEASRLLAKVGSRLVRWRHNGAVDSSCRDVMTEMEFDPSAFRGIAYLFDPHPERNQEMPSDVSVLLAYLAGKHGQDKEAGVNYCNNSLGEGAVHMWSSHGAWAAEMLRRQWPDLLDYKLYEQKLPSEEFCVFLTFSSARFGGVSRAFARIDGPSRTMTEEQKARLRNG